MAETGTPLKRDVKPGWAGSSCGMNKRRQDRPEFEKFKPDIFFDRWAEPRKNTGSMPGSCSSGTYAGSLGILMSNGDMISGDTLSNMFKPGTSPFIADRDELLSSITKLKSMDLRTIYPAHGKPFPRKGCPRSRPSGEPVYFRCSRGVLARNSRLQLHHLLELLPYVYIEVTDLARYHLSRPSSLRPLFSLMTEEPAYLCPHLSPGPDSRHGPRTWWGGIAEGRG